jgi:sialic acid synthase SpsE/mannose-6-phosphate isomerase-like protein (cupin superfamily)
VKNLNLREVFNSYLFTLDIANNHFGSLSHAKKIIDSFAPEINDSGLTVAIKLQLRDLSTFIHPDYLENSDYPKIKRFLSTKLEFEELKTIIEYIKSNNVYSMATPFDESSVSFIKENDIDIVKIASASAQEWPLLKMVATLNKPIIVSTGGLTIEEIDSLYDFFKGNGNEFAIMHCVSIYPTPNKSLNLNQIELLKTRYPDIPVGFSTHEEPTEFDPIKIALSKGATIFERHIGLEYGNQKLNNYSSTPLQIREWFNAFKSAFEMLGPINRAPANINEIEDLNNLKRGVYANKFIEANQPINESDVFFAMPLLNDGVSLKHWKDGMLAKRSIASGERISVRDYLPIDSEVDYITSIIIQSKSFLKSNNLAVPNEFRVELSHHYGLTRFREFGSLIFDIINFDYCKKMIITLPRQKHPYHFHKIKQETFIVVAGDLLIEIDGVRRELIKGDVVTVYPGQWHKFQSLTGCVFEEISTKSIDNDSYYQDDKISLQNKSARKTDITSFW